MKKKNLLEAYIVLSLLASCQQKENLQSMDDDLRLSLQASVYSSCASKVITDESGITTFSEKDEIGFFMPAENEPVKWTLTVRWLGKIELVNVYLMLIILILPNLRLATIFQCQI